MTNLYEIMVPTIIKGKPVRTRYHRVWDKKVHDITGGLTILKPAIGYWVSPVGVIRERMIPVRIACSAEQIEKIADFTAEYYEQDAIMYYEISNKVVIKNY